MGPTQGRGTAMPDQLALTGELKMLRSRVPWSCARSPVAAAMKSGGAEAPAWTDPNARSAGATPTTPYSRERGECQAQKGQRPRLRNGSRNGPPGVVAAQAEDIRARHVPGAGTVMAEIVVEPDVGRVRIRDTAGCTGIGARAKAALVGRIDVPYRMVAGVQGEEIRVELATPESGHPGVHVQIALGGSIRAGRIYGGNDVDPREAGIGPRGKVEPTEEEASRSRVARLGPRCAAKARVGRRVRTPLGKIGGARQLRAGVLRIGVPPVQVQEAAVRFRWRPRRRRNNVVLEYAEDLRSEPIDEHIRSAALDVRTGWGKHGTAHDTGKLDDAPVANGACLAEKAVAGADLLGICKLNE